MANTEAKFQPLSPDAFASLGSMEGLYDPIVEVTYVGPLSRDAFASFGSMEGLADVAHVRPESIEAVQPTPKAKVADPLWTGYFLVAVTTVAAYLICYLPFAPFTIQGEHGLRHPISSAIVAIIVGLLVRNLLPVESLALGACKKVVKKSIPIAIVLTGAGLNLVMVMEIGLPALAITIVCVAISIAAAYLIGRRCGLTAESALLIGAGTGICGNSAIVAVAPLLDADDQDLVVSIGTINLLGLIAMLVCPVLGVMAGMSDESFGVWSGTVIHAVPQVVAAGFAYSTEAGTVATLVKLVRVTLLAPLVAVLAIVYAKRHLGDVENRRGIVVHYARFVPWFVWGFVALAILNTLGFVPQMTFDLSESVFANARQIDVSLGTIFKTVAKGLLTLAMAAIGLELNIRVLARVGGRALVTGILTSVTLAVASFLLITLFL
jgi:uncharacterized integral membrane protein (TIGR00698 family)